VALDKPFGALNNGYYGPTMVRKTINYFPKDVPKGQGSASDPDRLRQPPGPLTRPLLELQAKTDLWVGFGVSFDDIDRGPARVGAR